MQQFVGYFDLCSEAANHGEGVMLAIVKSF